MILGIGASPGIAMGKVLLLENQELIIEKNISNDVEWEKNRFLNALELSKTELSQIKDKALSRTWGREGFYFRSSFNGIRRS